MPVIQLSRDVGAPSLLCLLSVFFTMSLFGRPISLILSSICLIFLLCRFVYSLVFLFIWFVSSFGLSLFYVDLSSSATDQEWDSMDFDGYRWYPPTPGAVSSLNCLTPLLSPCHKVAPTPNSSTGILCYLPNLLQSSVSLSSSKSQIFEEGCH